MQKLSKLFGFVRHQPKWRLVVVGVLVLVIGVTWLVKRPNGKAGAIPTFAARKGPLEITVLEGGSLQALESQEIKCEVRVGYQGTKILKIVEEGYQVTDEDVRTNKVLVELDSSDLQKQIVQQEIQFQQAAASLTDAQQGYDIQLNQNVSDIQAAEQKARFARMDFDKFLGDTVTQGIIDQIGLEKELAAEAANTGDRRPSADQSTLAVPPNSGLVVASAPSGDAPKTVELAG